MVDTTKMSATEVAAEHATEAHAPYLKVWAGLAVLTLVEYYYASFLKNHFLILLLGLLFLAVVKAGMVGWYFMHLKFEGNWVYIMIVPAMILATIIVLALSPDMVLKPETDENPGEEYACIAPAANWPRTILAARPEKGQQKGSDSFIAERVPDRFCS
jgi:cytochrome c oxidase subunit IV